MDHDGDWDVVVGEHNLANPGTARMLIYENTNGSGTAWDQHIVHTGDEHHDGAHVVDIDNDGDLDIVSIGWGHSRVVLYENLAGPCDGATPTPVPTGTPAPSNTPAPTDDPATTPTAPTSCDADGVNLVQNGGFEAGDNDWRFYTNGSGSLRVSALAYECDVAAQLEFNRVGNNMQLYQTDIALQPNTRYRLSFAAYSNSGHDFGLYLQKHTANYGSYGLDVSNVDLSTNWQTFTFEFTSNGFSSPVNDGRLRFWFTGKAAAGDRYFIDAVQLVEATANTPTPLPTATATSLPATATELATATATAVSTSTATATDTTTSPTATETPVTDEVTPTATATATPTVTPTVTAATDTCVDEGTNLVRNGGFEAGDSDWRFYTNGNANFTVTSPAYECNGTAALQFNSTGNNMQFYQTNIALEPNTRYRLSFAAYATDGHNLGVYLHKHSANYGSYGLDISEVDLTADWQTYSYEFTTSGFSSPVNDGRLRFWFVGEAAAGDRYLIDAIQLTTATAATATPVPTATATLVSTATTLPTATSLPTPTATGTATPFPDVTATAPPVATATATLTSTSTPAAIPTPTATPATSACNSDNTNVVRNGDFEEGNSDWRFYTNGSGDFTVTTAAFECTGAAELRFNRVGNNMQFYQTGITLEPNSRYRLSFAAYATGGHDLALYLHKHTADYGSYGLDISDVDLTTDWQTFSYEFTTSGFSSRVNDGRLRFWFVGDAAANDRYFFDAIQLTPIDAGAAAARQYTVFLPLLHNE